MQQCIVDVLTRNIPGDLIEAGVWRGGMAIFHDCKPLLVAYQVTDRKDLGSRFLLLAFRRSIDGTTPLIGGRGIWRFPWKL